MEIRLPSFGRTVFWIQSIRLVLTWPRVWDTYCSISGKSSSSWVIQREAVSIYMGLLATMFCRLLYSWGIMRQTRAVRTASRNSSLSSTDMLRAKREPSLRLLFLYSFFDRGPKSFFSTRRMKGVSR